MRLNKSRQYGLLLVFYICRSGKTTLEHVASNLNLSHSFLEQVACKLRKSGVLVSHKGPHGGYSLKSDPSVREVLEAFGPLGFLKSQEVMTYRRGGSEFRSLAHCATNLTQSLNIVLNRKVRNLGRELMAAESAIMDKVVSARGH